MSTLTALTSALAQSLSHTAQEYSRVFSNVLGLPFDLARQQYAHAVRAGLVENSMLAARDLELTLSALEQASLGPWARRL